MEERDEPRNFLQLLIGVEPWRYFEKAECSVCGQQWEFAGRTPAELRENLRDENRMCPYCDSIGEEERGDIRKRRISEKRYKGFFGWLLGI